MEITLPSECFFLIIMKEKSIGFLNAVVLQELD
jgi:hypothetical protein